MSERDGLKLMKDRFVGEVLGDRRWSGIDNADLGIDNNIEAATLPLQAVAMGVDGNSNM